ncbi:hypothetical protein [Desulfosporosinus sp. FKA]|uniref:hypothetical protein n=1 Tax=Desulfosporosinus sp. FKA TaxID=1969834 RepID=UPI001A9A2CA8|nr:hypothetical protein [Desulfosporosinus sp. FKA]
MHERLTLIGEPNTFPLPAESIERKHSLKGLYDICLALNKAQKIVENEVTADNKELVMITGANQGGNPPFCEASAYLK